MTIILITTDDKFNGELYQELQTAQDGSVRVETEDGNQWFDKGEYITVSEQEAKEHLFKQKFGVESKFEDDLDDAKHEIKMLNEEIVNLNNYTRG